MSNPREVVLRCTNCGTLGPALPRGAAHFLANDIDTTKVCTACAGTTGLAATCDGGAHYVSMPWGPGLIDRERRAERLMADATATGADVGEFPPWPTDPWLDSAEEYVRWVRGGRSRTPLEPKPTGTRDRSDSGRREVPSPSESSTDRSGALVSGTFFFSLVVLWHLGLSIQGWVNAASGELPNVALPVWTTLLTGGLGLTLGGVLAYRPWARDWAFGMSLVGMALCLVLAFAWPPLIFVVGAAVSGVAAACLSQTTAEYSRAATGEPLSRGLTQTLVGVVLLGTIGSALFGTTQGIALRTDENADARQAFVEDLQAHNPALVVSASDDDLVVSSPNDSDEQVDAILPAWVGNLSPNGRRSRIWTIGFARLRLTNGRHTAVCEAP